MLFHNNFMCHIAEFVGETHKTSALSLCVRSDHLIYYPMVTAPATGSEPDSGGGVYSSMISILNRGAGIHSPCVSVMTVGHPNNQTICVPSGVHNGTNDNDI